MVTFVHRFRVRDIFTLALIGILLASSLVLATSREAGAWTSLGCKYDGSNPTIDYKFVSVGNFAKQAVETAQANWDRSSSPGYFRPDNWRRDSEIDIYDASYSRSSWAFVSYNCDSDGTFKSNEVDLSVNLRTTTGLSSAEIAIVMAHELGHAYGLDHTTISCTASAGPSVMRQGTAKFACAGTAPWSDDVSGVNAIY